MKELINLFAFSGKVIVFLVDSLANLIMACLLGLIGLIGFGFIGFCLLILFFSLIGIVL